MRKVAFAHVLLARDDLHVLHAFLGREPVQEENHVRWRALDRVDPASREQQQEAGGIMRLQLRFAPGSERGGRTRCKLAYHADPCRRLQRHTRLFEPAEGLVQQR